jgi:hypothetical protein
MPLAQKYRWPLHHQKPGTYTPPFQSTLGFTSTMGAGGATSA